MQGTPQTMQINPKYRHVLLEIYDFFETALDVASIESPIQTDGISFYPELKGQKQKKHKYLSAS